MSALNAQEKDSWYKRWKLWAFVGYALIIIVICLFFFVSIQERPVWSLVPDSAFAFVSITIDENGGGTAALLDSLESSMLEQENSRLKKFLIKRAFSLLPERIIVIAATGKEAKPELLMIAKMGGILRFAKMFSSKVDYAFFAGQDFEEERTQGYRIKYTDAVSGRMGLRAYMIIGNTLVAGSSYTVLNEALTSHRHVDNKDEGFQHLTSLLIHGSEQYTFVLFSDNGARDLSKIVGSIEQKYAFAPFLSIDAVEMVYGNIFLAEDELAGQVTFLSNDITRLREVKSDVRYIYGAMRRILKPLKITLEGDVRTNGSRVLFDFRIPDHTNALINFFREKQGESE
jgi:hypothetical protein